MLDISNVMETAAHDPLVVVFGLFVLGGLATYFLFRNSPIWRAIVRVLFLILLTIAFVRAGIIPYQPLKWTGMALLDAVHGALKVAWWFWAAWFLVAILRAFVILERRPREDKLLQNLLAGLTYLAAVFAIIAYVFDLPIQGLLATSGAIAIILGLALQSTLSDVIYGVVLSFSRPYQLGDWISLEGIDGRVVEMNWRATHLLTGRHDLAIVPNSTIAKSKIINASSPSGIHGVTIAVQLDARTSPGTGTEVLEHAILNCQLIRTEPSPTVIVKSITATCTTFEVTFFVEELASSVKAQNQLFDLIFRHFAVSSVDLAPPENQNEPDRVQVKENSQGKTDLERLLGLVAIFAALTADERAAIAAKLKPASYDQGETLVKPGAVLHSLFIIGAGVISITRDETEGEIELLRLGPGDQFGEIGMLTGTPATVTITALIPATVYELAKDDLSPILKARPQVAQELGRALARRQAGARSIASDEFEKSVPANRLTAWFSDRMHRLFDL